MVGKPVAAGASISSAAPGCQGKQAIIGARARINLSRYAALLPGGERKIT